MKATWQDPHSHLARIAAVTVLVMVTLLAALVVIDVRASDATASTDGEPAHPAGPYVYAEACPEATAQFVKLGLEPPDTYTPDCPADAGRLGRQLERGLKSAAAHQSAQPQS
jgi:hypothetical protein